MSLFRTPFGFLLGFIKPTCFRFHFSSNFQINSYFKSTLKHTVRNSATAFTDFRVLFRIPYADRFSFYVFPLLSLRRSGSVRIQF